MSNQNKKIQGYFWSLEDDSEVSSSPASNDQFSLESLINQLDSRQKDAVTFPDLPLLVMGCPGTGKTFTLAARIAYRILSQKLQPSEVLVFTANRQGVFQIRNFLSKYLSQDIVESLAIYTFYEFCFSILQKELPSFPNLIAKEEVVRLFRKEHKELFSNYSLAQMEDILEKIWKYKRNLDFPEDILDSEDQKIYQAYQDMMDSYHLFDLEDLMLWTVHLLESSAVVQQKYLAIFHSIYVDEYQDINFAQYRLIRLLAPNEKTDLTVFGDPDQSICQFMGADIRYFLLFDQDYAHAKSIYLNENYRLSQEFKDLGQIILGRSMPISEKEPERSPLQDCWRFESSPNEAYSFLLFSIESILKGNHPFLERSLEKGDSTVGILFPSHWNARPLEKLLVQRKIPFSKQEKRILAKPEERLFLNFLRFLVNPENPYDLRSIVAAWFPRLQADLEKSSQNSFQVQEYISWLDQLFSPDEKTLFERHYSGLLSLSEKSSQLSLEEILGELARLFPNLLSLEKLLAWIPPDFHKKKIKDFLYWLLLQSPLDFGSFPSQRVQLLHYEGGKGMEFDFLFLLDWEHQLYLEEPEDQTDSCLPENQEERARLIYTLVSRARTALCLIRSPLPIHQSSPNLDEGEGRIRHLDSLFKPITFRASSKKKGMEYEQKDLF